MARAAHLVGVPFELRGTTLDGWDCEGCAKHVRQAIFDRPWHSNGLAVDYADAADPVARAAVIAGQLSRWTLLGKTLADVRPGAVLLFMYFGNLSHVGVALTRTEFIHAVGGARTSIVDLEASSVWANRLRGVYD